MQWGLDVLSSPRPTQKSKDMDVGHIITYKSVLRRHNFILCICKSLQVWSGDMRFRCCCAVGLPPLPENNAPGSQSKQYSAED